MSEFSPKSTELSFANAEGSAIRTVSDRFKGLGEKARSVAKMVIQRPALNAAALFLLVSSGCSNTETLNAPTVSPEPTPISTPVAVPILEAIKTPEKQKGLYFDGNHALVIPYSTELDGKKGMEIKIAFKASMPDKEAMAISGSDWRHLVIGGNDGHGGSSYQLDFYTSSGEDGEPQYGFRFGAGGLNTGLSPSAATKLNSNQLITVSAIVSELGIPQLTVNGEKVIGYNLSDRLVAAGYDVKSMEAKDADPTGRPASKFNNNEVDVLIGARLFNGVSADGVFEGSIEALQINGNKIDLNPANLQEVQK